MTIIAPINDLSVVVPIEDIMFSSSKRLYYQEINLHSDMTSYLFNLCY